MRYFIIFFECIFDHLAKVSRLKNDINWSGIKYPNKQHIIQKIKDEYKCSYVSIINIVELNETDWEEYQKDK